MGQQGAGSREQVAGSREQGTWSREQGAGSREQGAGSREQGAGSREQGWRSGESARFPPMWPGFDSRTRRHTWVEFVVGSRPCSERFFSGYSGSSLSSKPNTSKFQFDLESVPN